MNREIIDMVGPARPPGSDPPCPLSAPLVIGIVPCTQQLIFLFYFQDYIVGFTDLGNCDDFSTEMLEWRLGCGQAINYSGDLMNPPDVKSEGGKKPITFLGKKNKTIRDGDGDDDSDSDY